MTVSCLKGFQAAHLFNADFHAAKEVEFPGYYLTFNLSAPELFFFILALSLYKM
jgi:hypothetical protein